MDCTGGWQALTGVRCLQVYKSYQWLSQPTTGRLVGMLRKKGATTVTSVGANLSYLNMSCAINVRMLRCRFRVYHRISSFQDIIRLLPLLLSLSKDMESHCGNCESDACRAST